MLGATPRVAIRTPSLAGSINLKGAQIDDLVLVRQKQTIAKNSPPVRLLSPLGAPGAYIAAFGWTAQGARRPALTRCGPRTAPADARPSGDPHARRPDGARYQIKIAVDDGYLFTVAAERHQCLGRSRSPCARSGSSAAPKNRTTRRHWTNHVGPISVFGGKADYDVDWKTLDQAGAAERSAASAAGSASPTNIG